MNLNILPPFIGNVEYWSAYNQQVTGLPIYQEYVNE